MHWHGNSMTLPKVYSDYHFVPFTVAVGPDYGGVPTLEASGICLVGVAISNHAVKHHKAAVQTSPLYASQKG